MLRAQDSLCYMEYTVNAWRVNEPDAHRQGPLSIHNFLIHSRHSANAWVERPATLGSLFDLGQGLCDNRIPRMTVKNIVHYRWWMRWNKD